MSSSANDSDKISDDVNNVPDSILETFNHSTSDGSDASELDTVLMRSASQNFFQKGKDGWFQDLLMHEREGDYDFIASFIMVNNTHIYMS